MNENISIDDTQLKRFVRNIRGMKPAHRQASAELLTQMASNGRRNSIRNMERTAEIRSTRFMRSVLKYEGANPNADINRQQSRFGSIDKPRFTGWEEQETGRRAKKNRVLTLAARRGNWTAISDRAARLKGRKLTYQNLRIRTPKTERGKAIAMFAIMQRRREERAGLVPNSVGKIKAGLYLRERGEIHRAQTLDQHYRVRRTRWLTHARNEVLRRTDIQRQYNAKVRRIMSRGVSSR